jgi:hypothetical protein
MCLRSLCATFAALLALPALAGCGFHDPTEAIFYVRVKNDTSRLVVVSDCATRDGACSGRVFEPDQLKPGNSLPTVQASVGAVDVELITSTSGRRLGCLPLYFDYNASGKTVNVSEMVPCRRTYPVRAKGV